MTKPTIRRIIVAQMDELKVPDCDVRRVVMSLLDVIENPDRPGHTPMSVAALEALMVGIRDLYEPRSPLQVQLDAERAVRQLRELGIDVPPISPE